MSEMDVERLHHPKELEEANKRIERLELRLYSIRSLLDAVKVVDIDCLGAGHTSDGQVYPIVEEVIDSISSDLK